MKAKAAAGAVQVPHAVQLPLCHRSLPGQQLPRNGLCSCRGRPGAMRRPAPPVPTQPARTAQLPPSRSLHAHLRMKGKLGWSMCEATLIHPPHAHCQGKACFGALLLLLCSCCVHRAQVRLALQAVTRPRLQACEVRRVCELGDTAPNMATARWKRRQDGHV